ncbi:hypothetical protein B5F76_05810 [Desulfovibrio sp. An276]|uniref:cell envelope integrity protein TolA n=1 Tax=Desulfovibrio sp. An276 TaxID=1965618 RepID=UPI000B3AF282|nr:hypothetical protein [Desulfovibrio sp. An276]OUO53292.1 hypothetical protein B5F76_05810 [Desulfovibrio sp. An276]
MATDKNDITSTTIASDQQVRESAGKTYSSVGDTTNVFLASVRTYVAGILMPTIAVSISASFNAYPTARITMPADPRLFNLGNHDRVPVQIFVKETMVECPNYILMFEGFVAGRSYISVANQREINLECASFTEVFKDTKLRFMTSIQEQFLSSVPGNREVAQGIFLPGFMFPTCLFFSGLGLKTKQNGDTVKLITMPTEYLANLLQYMEEAATKIAPAGRYNDSIVSKYFATLAYNLHFDRRFCWLPYFDIEVEEAKTATNTTPIKGAWEADGIKESERGAETTTMFPVLYGVKTDAASSAIMSALQTSSTEFSIADLLSFLVEKMEYEFLVIPNPAFQAKGPGEDLGLKADQDRKATLSATDMGGKGPDNDKTPISEQATAEDVENLVNKYAPDRNCNRMIQFCLKPMFDDTFPPQCNVIFRSQVVSVQASTTYNGVPTRIQVSNFNPLMTYAAQTGTANNGIAMFGTVDFYPSAFYGQALIQPDSGRAVLSEQLLDIEKHTGPWVHKDTMPSWMYYAFLVGGNKDVSYIGKDAEQIKKMREQYMRRQLMRAQIVHKTLNVDCVFLPYLTCGFPALVYDSGDSGFSFAGNVIAYEHSISAEGMSTSVSLNGVRLLAEAVEAEDQGAYPNPINSVHVVTHNVDRLKKVYEAILGTKDITVSGAEPITWKDAKAKWSATVDNVATSPQTNIYEAYKLQRRNIVTFDDYCSFMGLNKSPGGDDEDGNIPVDLSNEWMNDRAPIQVYQPTPLRQVILPSSALQQAATEKAALDEQIKKLEEENKKLESGNNDATVQAALKVAEAQSKYDAAQAKVSAPGGNTANNIKERDAAKVALDKQLAASEQVSKASEQAQATIAENNKKIGTLKAGKAEIDKAAQSKEKNQGFSSDAASKDLRALLKAVREEEMAHNIY